MGVQVPALVTAEAGLDTSVQHGQQQLLDRMPREQIRALWYPCHILVAGLQHGLELRVLVRGQVCREAG